MAQHATLAPSAAHRWMRCAGSVALEAMCADESSDFADEGTAAHYLASQALASGYDLEAYQGQCFRIGDKDWEFTPEMVGHVRTYINLVRSIPGELRVEQALNLEAVTGEAGAKGTVDAVILTEDGELVIADLKYGRGVKVDAEHNEQLAIYARAAVEEFGFLDDFQRVRMVIVQPRLNHTGEWSLPIAKDVGDGPSLEAFVEEVKHEADRCRSAQTYFAKHNELHEKDLTPGEKQCRFCKAKAICPALRDHVLQTVAGDFVDVTQPIAPQIAPDPHRSMDNTMLGRLMASVDLVEVWCKAIRAATERELLAGRPVPGFKLVEGRRGARAWTDAEEAEAALKAMRLKTEQIYDFKLISPTTAGKLHKSGTIGPRQWPRLQGLITQADGKPSVAPDSDKRPGLTVSAPIEDFDDLTGEDDLV